MSGASWKDDQLKQVMLFAVGPDGSCRVFGLNPVFGTGPGDMGYHLSFGDFPDVRFLGIISTAAKSVLSTLTLH